MYSKYINVWETLFIGTVCVKIHLSQIVGIRYRKCISSVNTSLDKDESRYLSNNVNLYISGSKLDVRCKNIFNKYSNDIIVWLVYIEIFGLIRTAFYDELYHATLQNRPWIMIWLYQSILLLSFNVLMHQNEGINLYIKATSIWSIGKNTNDQNNNSLHLTARAITQFHIERTLRSSYCILFLSQSIALILIYKKEKTVHIQWTRNVFSFLTS